MPLNKNTLKTNIKSVFEDVTNYKILQANFVKINSAGEVVADVDKYQAAVAEGNARAQAMANDLADALTNWIETGTVTIPPNTIATAGSPSAQVGPPSPIPLNGAIS